MASICKRQRNCDRISNLPDNVITYILSFLSTKDAVKTSALSTSWNQQWTLVPLIRLGKSKIICSSVELQMFVNFVYRVLLYKATPLDLFQLRNGWYDNLNVSNWISIALSRHVRQIDVDAFMPSPCYIPDSLFSSKTLVVLKLEGHFVFQVPVKISLESLKIFHYNVDDFEGGESFSRLVSSCPVLEELQIIGHLNENVKVLNISSLVLKRLILTDLYPVPEIGPPHYELVLNTPNLQYLEHKDEHGLPDGYHLNTLHCLDTAHLSLYLCDDRRWQLPPARSLAGLVVAISNVRILYISQNAFETLYNTALPNFELPKFHRLISLELGLIESDAGLKLLTAFLQSSPLLESLSLNLDCWDETWCPPTDVPFCLLYNLKVIEVTYFNTQKPFLSMMTYFLENTNFLEKLKIPWTWQNEKYIKKILWISRASNSCEIIYT